ncbi:sensor histidine kinase [[Empedobacter] haloabium]|uniref:histidine kinase n=1 Tax=[Empedobacter] haloabium TaxID=592317 RepID=A0ABZ1UFW7_9BURK
MLDHPPIRLADFIEENMEQILQAWEDFARTIEPPALTMDDAALRDHARQMLHAFASDLATAQTALQQAEKSKGLAARGHRDTAAETHAEARLQSGYTVVQLVSEYRALRSSVLTLWSAVRTGVATDMTDVTRFNEAVDQAVAESVARYEQMVKQSQNMFLAILGHDLRNPLGTVVSGSSFIMQAVDIPPKYVLAANRIFNSSQRMSRLIADLIDFTRTHLGPGIPVKVRQANLARVCRTVVDELRTSHPEQIVTLAAPEHLDAIFDEERVAQVLSNLVGNAIQYGTHGAPVTVRMVADEDYVTVAVNNQGPAVPADRVPALFDPMVRMASDGPDTLADTLVERTSLGLGLFIARQIVQAHDGRIEVVSDAQEGTTFTVTLPRQPETFLAPRPAPGGGYAEEALTWISPAG